jgi:hypothetical protein
MCLIQSKPSLFSWTVLMEYYEAKFERNGDIYSNTHKYINCTSSQ